MVRSLFDFDYPKAFESIKPIIHAIAENLFYEDKQFKIEVLIGDARKVVPQIKEKIDVIYQDAFSPAHNPLLWTKQFFSDIAKISKEDTLLTTYSTAAVRLGLYENGFLIFVHYGEKSRYSTIASMKMLEHLEYIDMELKKLRNPTAQSLKDEDFL